jgi:chemotaxis family two-component system response regulator Rcp1
MTEVHILLVEDSHQDALLIREALRDTGLEHKLTTATDGEGALQILYSAEYRPNIVFLDLNLPKISGLEVLKEMKRDSGLRSIPVIILTNSMSEDDVVTAYANHCNAYVRKPLGFERLMTSLNHICQFWFDTATLPKHRATTFTSSPPETLAL